MKNNNYEIEHKNNDGLDENEGKPELVGLFIMIIYFTFIHFFNHTLIKLLAKLATLVAKTKIYIAGLGVIKLGFLGTGALAGFGYVGIIIAAIAVIGVTIYFARKYFNKSAAPSAGAEAAAADELGAAQQPQAASSSLISLKVAGEPS